MWRWTDTHTGPRPAASDAERGSALMLALMVSVVLIFLGMGLLLQTSLGLQAAGTDRWVVKALYAADSGAMMQVLRLQQGGVAAITATVVDDPGNPGLTQGQFAVNITRLCETGPPSPVFANGVPSGWPEFQTRHFHVNSVAQRTVGNLVGLTNAEVELDVSVFPFSRDNFVPLASCVN
jgi:Tfp pilus assembly protein PilX